MAKIKVVVVRVGKPPALEEIDSGLESMQKVVGGYVQGLNFEDGLTLWCNEEARLLNLPFNRNIMARAPEIPKDLVDFVIEVKDPDDPPFAKPGEMGYHKIYGDFFFSWVDKGGNTKSLRDKDLPRVQALVGAFRSK